MGTPDFAVESLKKLYESNFEIVGVVTSPDKPAGRGLKVKFSALKEYAIEHNLNILQPTNLKDENFLKQLSDLNPDLQIVVAFRMLPKSVWSLPKYGTFNLHASLLPQYRGAAPINWAIINGEKKTGITTFFIEENIDTGNIIFQEEIEISENENAGSLHDRLMVKGADLVVKTVESIINKSYTNIPQSTLFRNDTELKSAPKIFKENCKIDWNNNLQHIHNFIRGMSPHPAAWTEIIDKTNNLTTSVKIFEAEIAFENHDYTFKQIVTDNKNYLKIYLKDGYISIKSLQLSGKKTLKIKDFLIGYDLKNKEIVP